MLFPLAAALVQPALKGLERFRFDPAGSHAALFLRSDELAIFQKLHVLHDGGEGHVQWCCDLADGFRACSQLLDNGAPGGIGEGLENSVELG